MAGAKDTGISVADFPVWPYLCSKLKFGLGGTSMHDPQHVNGIIAAVIGFYLIFLVVIMAAIIIPFWFIL